MRHFLLAAASLTALACATAAAAQDAPAAVQPTTPWEREDGVLIYPPAFFADARPNTAADMVARIPGFSINQNSSVRGFSGAVGNVLFDGSRPASKDESLSGLLQRIPAGQVERIEVIRGSAPGVDMQGYPVVINVVRARTASRQVVVSAGSTVFDDGRYIPSLGIELSGSDGDRQYSVALNTSTSISDSVGSGSIRRVAPDGTVLFEDTIESEADGDGLSARGRWQQNLFGGEIELTGNAGFYDFKMEQDRDGVAGLRNIVDAWDTRSAEAGVRYARPLGDRTRAEGRFIQTWQQQEGSQTYRSPMTDQLFAYDNTSGESILRGSLTFEQSPTVTFETGAEGAFNFLDAAQALTIDGDPVPLPSDSVRVEELRGEVFGTATWRPTEQVTMEGGLRLERSTISQSGGSDLERTFTFLKPRFVLTWTPGEHDQIRLRVEREVGQLDFGDFAASANLSNEVVIAGNANLSPQSSWVGQLAWERRFWTDGVFTATLTHEELSDVIDVIPVTDGVDVYSAPGNIGSGTLSSLVLETTIPTDRWGVTGGRWITSLLWREAEVTDPTTGEQRDISGLRNVEYYTSFRQDIAGWNTNWGVEYQNAGQDTVWRVAEVSTFRFEDFASAWVEYKPTPAWSLRLQGWMIQNIEHTRVIYPGPRDVSTPAYTEIRSMEPESRIQFRVRRTF